MLQDFKDYYGVLEVAITASETDIKAAYRRLAREYHPDKHPEEAGLYTEKFQELTEAYETLSDPMKKGVYDFRYRQLVLHEGPRYEDYYDETPEDETVYQHKYTARNRKSFSYFPAIALIILAFQFLRMVFDAAPVTRQEKYNSALQPLPPTMIHVPGAQNGNLKSTTDSVNREFSNAPFLEQGNNPK